MNPLAHAFIALSLFKQDKLTKDEKDHLIVGSILPDIHLSHLMTYQQTHYQSIDFFQSIPKQDHLTKMMALGMVLHGEHPCAVDYYTHKKGGLVDSYKDQINKLARQKKHYIGTFNSMTHHHLIEFAGDSILALRDRPLVEDMIGALENPKLDASIAAFADYFQVGERTKAKIIRLIRSRHLRHFFENFKSQETAPRSWTNITFLLNLRNDHSLPLRSKLGKLTQFSLFNLQRKLHHVKVAKMFEEINLSLEQPILEFIYKTIDILKPLKQELYKKM